VLIPSLFEDWLKTIHPNVFDPGKDVFSRFMDYMELEMPPADSVDKHFKSLTESEIEKKQRREKERKERKEREEKEQAEAEEKAAREEKEMWVTDCSGKIFKDKHSQFIDTLTNHLIWIEKKHGENGKGIFKQYLKKIEQIHQQGQKESNSTIQRRKYGYYNLLLGKSSHIEEFL
jgi:hypothetical protein